MVDHPRLDGLDNMYSIVGGKLTTCRQMAEAVVDRLAERMGVTEPCRTATEVLPGADHGPTGWPSRWPGSSGTRPTAS